MMTFPPAARRLRPLGDREVRWPELPHRRQLHLSQGDQPRVEGPARRPRRRDIGRGVCAARAATWLFLWAVRALARLGNIGFGYQDVSQRHNRLLDELPINRCQSSLAHNGLYYPTLHSRLPASRPMNASGEFSIPSTTSSRYFRVPSCTQPARRRTETAEDIIVCRNANKWFGNFQALKDINTTVKRGEKVVIVGPPGRGGRVDIRADGAVERHWSHWRGLGIRPHWSLNII